MTNFLTAPTLHTERLTLRMPSIDDFDAEAVFYASDASRFVGGPLHPNLVWRTLALIIGHWHMRGYGFWAVEETSTGAYLGRVGAWCPHGWPEPELGWSLLQSAQGKGFAIEAAVAARNYVYGTLGWQTTISLIDPNNIPSIKLATKLGAYFERDFHHEQLGAVGIYRHPSAEMLA